VNIEDLGFIAKNQDQIKEAVNTQQRYGVFLDAWKRKEGYKGSMSFGKKTNVEYLLRDYYDNGVRKQKVLGQRSPETEKMLADYLAGREDADVRLKAAQSNVARQAGINRALGLGRVPAIGAKIIRAVDKAGLLGKGVKVIGTNAMFAYEAITEVYFPQAVTSTEDIDMMFDARAKIRFTSADDETAPTIIGLLRQVDKSFVRAPNRFSANNNDGYIVDLVRPQINPPWKPMPSSLSDSADDLEAIQIGGLSWHENAQTFEAVAIDTRGEPVRIIAPDPRAFAVHKHWLSKQPDRRPDKRARDRCQAALVAALVAQHMPHLPFDPDQMKSFPRKVVDDAAHLFEATIDLADQFTF
jgi:hypothetical protein